MVSKIQTGIIVAILSCLIWVFAERAVTREDSKKITITLEEVNRKGDLLVQFLDESGTPTPLIQQEIAVTARGPAARILELNQSYITQLPLKLALTGADLEQIIDKKRFTVPVISLLDKGLDSIDGKNFLQVVDTKPASLALQITRLASRKVPVVVVNSSGNRVAAESIEPAEIDGWVDPTETQPVVATVRLTVEQQTLALAQPVMAQAQLIYPHRGSGEVRILLKKAINLMEDRIRQPRLFILKPFTMEEYQVVIDDLDTKLEAHRYIPLEVRGTPEAIQAYRDGDYHLMLRLTEQDRTASASSEITRALEYYVPDSLSGLEVINKESRPMKFQLVRIPNPSVTPPATTPAMPALTPSLVLPPPLTPGVPAP